VTFRQGYRRRDTHEKICKCDHPHLAHYSRDGHCVVAGCGCLEYRPKGRPEYATAKRARCEHGHSHDSGLEIKECWDLTVQKRSGDIRDFKFHPVVDLPGPSGRTVARYEVDFRVDYADGTTEWVECKGDHLAREQGWRIKWALLQDMHWKDPTQKFRVRRG